MEKTDLLFDIRNNEKKKLQKMVNKTEPNAGEIWMYKTGVNLGNEISRDRPFMRPCIVLNNFVGGDLILTVPITSKKHNGKFEIELKDYLSYGLKKISYILANQIRPISKKRLVYKVNAIKRGNIRIKLIGKAIIEMIKNIYITKIFKI